MYVCIYLVFCATVDSVMKCVQQLQQQQRNINNLSLSLAKSVNNK